MLNPTPAQPARKLKPAGANPDDMGVQNTPKQGATLAQALTAASWVTHAVTQGHSLTTALADLEPWLPAAHSTSALRGAVQDLCFLTQRQLGRADALLFSLSKKPITQMDAGLLALMRVTMALLCEPVAAGKTPRYDTHTVVDQAVRAVHAVLACRMTVWVNMLPQRPAKLVMNAAGKEMGNANTQAVAGFVNGVLRTYLREQATRDKAAQQTDSGQWNHPAWWVRRLQADYPKHWQLLLAANNVPAPMTLRANARVARVGTAAQAQAQLAAQGIDAHLVAGCPNAVSLVKALPVAQIPQFDAGWYSVQDAAAQVCVDLLDIQAGHRVLDACAAPGGKTAHILERHDVVLTAVDIAEARLNKVRASLVRIAPTLPKEIIKQFTLHAADAADLPAWWDGVPFDRVLLDAPCSASGVVRRHPDVRWLRRESDLAVLMDSQTRLLDALWQTVAPNGLLLYVTCSVFKCEGEAQIEAFLQKTRTAKRLPCLGHTLYLPENIPDVQAAVQTDSNPAQLQDAITQPSHTPVAQAKDGFYYALLRKLA